MREGESSRKDKDGTLLSPTVRWIVCVHKRNPDKTKSLWNISRSKFIQLPSRHLDCNICHILPKYSLSKNNFIKNPYKLRWKKEENLNSKLNFRILQTKNIRQAAPSPSLFLILFGRNYSLSNVFCFRRTAFIKSM